MSAVVSLLAAALIPGGACGIFGWWLGRRGKPVEPRAALPSLLVSIPRARPEALVELLPVAAVLLRSEGGLSHANRAARMQFGESLGAVIRHPGVHAALERLAAEESIATTLELDVPVRRVVLASFQLVPAELFPPGEGENAEAHVLVILDDRSDAEAVDRMRADFVAHASHELRTPLASLVGFIETLRGPAADDPVAQQQFLAIMAAQAGRMQRLIDRLLYLSRVQRLEHTRPKSVVSVSDVVDRLMDETTFLMRDADASLTFPFSDEGIFFLGDEDQIVQVLLNLVENAVKYGGPGVDVTISLTVDADVLRFLIEDNGPGIEARHIPRLTERFYRIESHGTAQVSGTGLGLSIVKHIVDRHGGKLVIRSSVGRGTQCEVSLPLPG
ncbi:ATP-binding protein [Acidomonas methanolica]|uniref:histidine kinase n=2 Tax=Acidomonas methanolica TaxID=437 RepID=A0A023D482_ACIMT|nr:ATP-binding protein [Acidomonas methanolica]MBU2654488.1 sensor histidine kinase [Acidomonas methanolica]TCS28291.1 two-component system phosphate regulon sensor histidine kinase PhoR [Acidomonas methanolica]GAJ28575.1 two component sensor histidine kinase PhoR [Acidomonas methanolica NBRC 104435]GEK99008.1 two-component sensor histidine kinase [Acidomonas methanolica NBRC 104435]